jgi:hypothetical protein
LADALEQASCLRGRLNLLDEQLDALVDRALALENTSGEQATQEQRQNIRDAEAAGKEYRDKHCWFDYVPSQLFNVSSRQVENLLCEIRQAIVRKHDITIDYLADWR